MQIVIEITDKMYEQIKQDRVPIDIGRFIRNGIPLPKEHGKIADIDAIYQDICDSIEEMTKIGIIVDGKYLWDKLNDAIDNAPTIIEADKESE